MTAPRRVATPQKRRRRVLAIIAWTMGLVLVAGMGLVGWYVARLNQTLNAIPRVDFNNESTPSLDPNVPLPPAPTAEPSAPAVPSDDKGMNFMLLGTDYARGGSSRSDSFMLAHLNQDRSKLYIISFTRDSYVDIPGRGKGKINWAYQWGGVPLAKKTIEQLVGVGIDHTAQVDFDGFIALSDVVDGVTVYNPSAFTNQVFFPQGEVQLQGERALWFVRARYGLPRWDLSRAANQRAVVKAIIMKSLRPEYLANPVKFNALLDGAAKCIKVDTGLTNDVIRDLALSMRLKSSADIVLMQAPITGFGSLKNGDSINVVDANKTRDLGIAIASDTLDQYVAMYGTKGYEF